jgi:endonuclease/exonuclease/phosphatase family metal-dependent hydrolase
MEAKVLTTLRPVNTPLRILTANLFGGRADPVALAELIEELAVDVACVQELNPRLADALSRLLPWGQLGPNEIGRGLGIACRHDAEVKQFYLPKRLGWVARLSPTNWSQIGEPIEIVNVHIMGPHTWPYFPRRLTRQGQLSGLLSFVDREPHIPRAILGDFNSSPIWPLYRRLAAQLTDSVVVGTRGGSNRYLTWPHLPLIGIRGLFRIDHCFLSNLTALDVQVVSLPGSDHLGLCVDVILGETTSAKASSSTHPATHRAP